MGTTAAIYLRVSTDQQDSAHQLPDCQRLAAARGWQVVEEYRDDGVSGAAQCRPALERMLADAHRGKFETLLIWSLDRLGRGGIAQVAGIVAKLDAAGVGLVSVREPWADSTGPVRDLLVSIFAWVAAQERARLLERLAAARARLEKQGRRWGRPRRLDAAQVQRIREMKAAGKFTRQIAVAVRTPRSTVRRALARASSQALGV
ncbi:MAG TPA: recombinase family protein [Gemmatimonadales bacterium]|nr:recombinase family protein [Gemmatimonadales bacterium]